MPEKTLFVIAGPTAVGKTALSISIAKKFSCPVISADSRQFFREMNIGTAKPDAQELAQAEHYLVSSHSIHDGFNVGKYEAEVIPLLEKLFTKHDQVILVGGSGLYIDAVCKGFDELPEANESARKEISELLMNEGITALQRKLQVLDPEHYETVDLNNPQRLSRALEVCISTGKKYSELRKGKVKQRPFRIIKIAIDMDRKILYDRINARVDKMISDGLIDEAKALFENRSLNALQTVGYKELFQYIEGKCTLEEAIEQIKQNTRNYAKRQLTWFRRDNDMVWFQAGHEKEIIEHLEAQTESV